MRATQALEQELINEYDSTDLPVPSQLQPAVLHVATCCVGGGGNDPKRITTLSRINFPE